jgi:hypothetical protein
MGRGNHLCLGQKGRSVHGNVLKEEATTLERAEALEAD